MTDPTNATSAAPPCGVPSRKLKIALAVSVALNLAVLGLVGGAFLKGGPFGHGDMMVRDLGFGPFDQVLEGKDRDALRKSVQGRVGDIRASRQQMQADVMAIVAALRAEPFDRAALTASLDSQAAHLEDRIKFGSDMIGDFLAGTSNESRLAIADRLEHRFGSDRGPSRDVPKN